MLIYCCIDFCLSGRVWCLFVVVVWAADIDEFMFVVSIRLVTKNGANGPSAC